MTAVAPANTTPTAPALEAVEDALAAARAFLDDGAADTGYVPFDQVKRIRHWDRSRSSDWTLLAEHERREFFNDRDAWQDAHGHDVRLKCYVEFGCAAIESQAVNIVGRLVAQLEHLNGATHD